MTSLRASVAAAVLVLHGLVHLLGTAAYLRLAEVPDLPYETTVLSGAVDLGETGIAVFGVLWAVAAVGFVASAAGLLTQRQWWRTVLVAATVFSLVLTALDWESAYAGVLVNVGILAALAVDSRS